MKVFSLNDTTKLASNLYLARRLSHASMSIVVRAVHICISTALRNVPIEAFDTQKLLEISGKYLYIPSGLVKCGDCGGRKG